MLNHGGDLANFLAISADMSSDRKQAVQVETSVLAHCSASLEHREPARHPCDRRAPGDYWKLRPGDCQ